MLLCTAQPIINIPAKHIGTDVRGKVSDKEILANLVNDAQFAKNFPTNSYCTCKYSESTEDLSSDSPKYSSSFASSTAICQNFTPPIFSHI